MNLTNSFFSLRKISLVPDFDSQFERNERAKFARTRKEIELHQQDLLQRAFIEERQISA